MAKNSETKHFALYEYDFTINNSSPVSDKSVVRAPGTTKNFYGQLTNRCVVAQGQPKRCRVQ